MRPINKLSPLAILAAIALPLLPLMMMAGQVGAGFKPAPIEASASAAPPRCLIVKHKGLIGRRLMFFALIAIPIAPGTKYDLVDSVNYKPERVDFNGKHLQELQKQNVRIIILEKKYTQESLDAARKFCREPDRAVPTE